MASKQYTCDKGYYSYLEIAQMLGTTVENIRKIEKRALAKIKAFHNRHRLFSIRETLAEVNNRQSIEQF